MATLKFKVFVPVQCVVELGTAAGFDAQAAMSGKAQQEAAPRVRGTASADSQPIKLVEMTFVIRPMLPTDAQHLLRGMRQLMSKHSLFMRFMRPVDGLSSMELAYLTDLDYWDRFAWVLGIILPAACMTPAAAAEAAMGASHDLREIGIAVARYIRVQDPGAGSYNAVRSHPHCAAAALETIASSLQSMLGGGSLPPGGIFTAPAPPSRPSDAPHEPHARSAQQFQHTALLKGTSRREAKSGEGGGAAHAEGKAPPPRISVSHPSDTDDVHPAPPTPRGKTASTTAELAVTVADCFHQCGFATLLLWALSQVALRHGVKHFVGVSHEDNYKVSEPACMHLCADAYCVCCAGERPYGKAGWTRNSAQRTDHTRCARHAVLCAATAAANAVQLHHSETHGTQVSTKGVDGPSLGAPRACGARGG